MNYFSIQLKGDYAGSLPEEVSPISYQKHITMGVTSCNKDEFPKEPLGGCIKVSGDLTVLIGHHTKQIMMVLPVIMNDSFREIVAELPDDESSFDRIYHVTVGILPYDEHIDKVENLQCYASVSSECFEIDALSVEPFAPVVYQGN